MKTHGWTKVSMLLVFAGLMLAASIVQAEHTPTRNPYTGQPLLHSSGAGYRSTAAAANTCTVDPAKELFITDVSVVDDCYRTTWNGTCSGTEASPATRGAWTFGRVMEGVFGTNDPKKLSNRVRQWLNTWTEEQTVNGQTVQARRAMRDLVLRPWERASGGNGNKLDMKKAPFRLLAHVVRTDIGEPIFLENLQLAGELRLIYGVLDEHGNPAPFTIILEYVIVAHTCQEILDYAHAFHTLSSYEFGPEYNAALQEITDRIISRGASPGRLNGSSLGALRTNENFLGSPWEMRSFRLERDDAEPGTKNAKLVPHFNELTPAASYQNMPALADFINLHAQDILDGNLLYPTHFQGQPFLAGVVHNNQDLGWDGPPPACSSIVPPPRLLRFLFSGFTCQGCHGKDTGTNFVHVTPRLTGQPSSLSGLLRGNHQVTDACNFTFGFNDLQRRRDFQCFLLTLSCPNE